MGRPVHFEIQATHMKAAAAFYGALFGWRFNQQGDYPYMLAETGEGPGINGAIMQRQGPAAATGAPVMGATLVMGVGDLDASLARASELGAALAVGKRAIPGIGWSAYLRDPDGNLVGLFQEDTEAR